MFPTILIVDDELPIIKSLSGLLTDEGFEVTGASNGYEALQQIEADTPDLVLLDIWMPGFSGIETCKRLKENEKTRFIPVIVATALWDTYEEAVEAGAEDFVTKPFNLAEISFRVKSILRVRYLNDELERAVAYIQELEKNRPKL